MTAWNGMMHDMSEDNPQELPQKQLEIALGARGMEIQLFWTRSLFFWGFIAAAFLGFAELVENRPNVATVVAGFGLVCSMAWTLANRGSKYWHEAWEAKVQRLQLAAIGKDLFGSFEKLHREKGWFAATDHSVSRLTIALSDFTVLLWLGINGVMIYKEWPGWGLKGNGAAWGAVACGVFSILYCMMLVHGRIWLFRVRRDEGQG